jgi:hypothetical protein
MRPTLSHKNLRYVSIRSIQTIEMILFDTSSWLVSCCLGSVNIDRWEQCWICFTVDSYWMKYVQCLIIWLLLIALLIWKWFIDVHTALHITFSQQSIHWMSVGLMPWVTWKYNLLFLVNVVSLPDETRTRWAQEYNDRMISWHWIDVACRSSIDMLLCTYSMSLEDVAIWIKEQQLKLMPITNDTIEKIAMTSTCHIQRYRTILSIFDEPIHSLSRVLIARRWWTVDVFDQHEGHVSLDCIWRCHSW